MSDDEQARAIVELEETLQLPLPNAARQQLEATLQRLRQGATVPVSAATGSADPTTGTVTVSGTLRGAAVGVNQGTVQLFFGSMPDKKAEPLLVALLAWLEALARPDDRAVPRTLQERTQALIQAPTSASAVHLTDKVRLLLAQGALQWVADSPDLPQPVPPLVRQSLGAAALLPLIVQSPLPPSYLSALEQISSPGVTQLVLNEGLRYLQFRRIRNPEAVTLTMTSLTRALGEAPYVDGLARLLADLSDPQRGGPALAAAWHAQQVSDTPVWRVPDFFRLLAAGAIGGTIGAIFVAMVARLIAVQAPMRPDYPESEAPRHPTSSSGSSPGLFIPVTSVEWRATLERRNERFGEPADVWCYVRPGIYRIGGWGLSNRAANIRLSAFWIARVSITVAQYAPFVEVGYHAAARRWWTPQGWAWKVQGNRRRPWRWGEERFCQSDQPVIGVTWYEATAYCAWLSEQLRDGLPSGYVLRLPTEAEWEAAADYDANRQRRSYPWGDDEPTPERAIYHASPVRRPALVGHASNVRRPAPVGCCPAGAAACGALNMVGNVWEWTASSPKLYPQGSDAVIKDFTSYWEAPVRGGTWFPSSTSVCCAARLSSNMPIRLDIFGFRVIVGPHLA